MTRPALKTLPTGIANPDGCEVCGNVIEVRGYDCWACEIAHDAPVNDTAALAVRLAMALSEQIVAEGGKLPSPKVETRAPYDPVFDYTAASHSYFGRL